MKVKELITLLSKCDHESDVFLPHVTGGLVDVFKIEEVRVCRNVSDEWDWGPHEEFETLRKGPDDPFSYDIVDGIIIT
jgi:hypothetical protein